MEKFKVGIIGLGCRGNTMGMLVAEHENCAITAICDEYQDRCDAMKEKLAPLGHDPEIFLNYEELIASPEVEMVFVFSAWENHVPAAVAAMRAINALSLANFLTSTRKVKFDTVVETMYQTGKDLKHHYRETSEGGLAVNYEALD